MAAAGEEVTWPLARLSRSGRRRAGRAPRLGSALPGPAADSSQARFRQHLGNPVTPEFCDLGQTVRLNLDFSFGRRRWLLPASRGFWENAVRCFAALLITL